MQRAGVNVIVRKQAFGDFGYSRSARLVQAGLVCGLLCCPRTVRGGRLEAAVLGAEEARAERVFQFRDMLQQLYICSILAKTGKRAPRILACAPGHTVLEYLAGYGIR